MAGWEDLVAHNNGDDGGGEVGPPLEVCRRRLGETQRDASLHRQWRA
jgi:hypothetical protein